MTKDRGILYPGEASEHFKISRIPLVGDLGIFVEHVWIIRWNLPRNKTYQTEVLSYPAVNIVFANDNGSIAGVSSERFTYTLKGHGSIVGVLFKPAWAHAFLRRPLGETANKNIPLDTILGKYDSSFAKRILASKDTTEITQMLSDLLIAQQPSFDILTSKMEQVVAHISQNRSIKKVSDLVEFMSVGRRRIEQLFYEYVGMTPKHAILRFRLQEAADRIYDDPNVRLTDIGHDLGYSDQSHFTKDFQRVIGCTPSEYSKRQAPKTRVQQDVA